MAKWLRQAFNIHPDEQRMVLLVLIYAIFLYFSNVMARTASTALFFSEYDASQLPYTSIFLMFIGPLVSLVYLRLNNKLALSTVLLGIHGFLLLSLIALPLILNNVSAPVLMFTLPIYFGVNNSLTISSFWNLLGRIYNLRQGKRLFGLLSSGEHMATIVAGFMAPVFVSRIGTINLYWIGAFFMLLTIAMLVVLNRMNEDKMGTVVAERGGTTPTSGMRDLIKEPYVRLIFALFALFIVGIMVVGNISYAQAEIRFPTAEGMATYIGVFMGIFGALSLIVQWFIAGRVLDRFGVRSMIMATPVGLFLFMVVFAIVGTFTNATTALFWLAAGAAMWQSILDAVDSAAINIMYQPLPAQLRTQAQTTVIGIVYPVAIGLAGLLLVFCYDVLGFNSVQLAYMALIVIAIWIFVGLRLGRAYPVRLKEALQQRSLGGLTLARPNRASLPVFEDALSSDSPAAVLYALDMLQEVAPETIPGHLPALLAYPDEEVQVAALEQVARNDWPQTPAGVLTLLRESENPAIRAAALHAWYAINPQEAKEQLVEYGRSAPPALRRAALTLMRLENDEAVSTEAAQIVGELAQSPEAADRMVAAGVIGDTALPDEVGLLLALLEDDNAAVRRAALVAAARARFPETWPVVIPGLARADTRAQAATVLIAGGQDALPAMIAACSGPDLDPQVIAGIAAICGRIGGPEAVAFLETQIDHPNLEVRRQALAALSRCAYQAPPQQREHVAALLRKEAQAASGLVAAQVDLGDKSDVYMPADALAQTRLVETDNLLLLLSFLGEPQTVLSAREALQPNRLDDEKKSYAIEALDILLDQQQKALLFPYLQEIDLQERFVQSQKVFPQELLGRDARLLSLLQSSPQEIERWTRICVIYALGLLQNEEAADAIVETAVRYAKDDLLVETALNSLQEMGADLDAVGRDNPALQAAASLWQARDARAMTVMQKTAHLKQVSIFEHLPNEVLQDIAALMSDLYVAPGDTVIKRGDLGDCLYVVVEGHLRVHEGDHTYDTLGVGGVAGEMALLDAQPRSASVTAVTDSHLLKLDQEPFYDLLAGQPQVARDLMSLLSQRLRGRTADLPKTAPTEAARPVLPIVSFQAGMNSSVAVQGQLMDLDKVFVLKGVDLFGGSDDNLLGQVALLLEEVDLAGGEELFHAGDPGRSLYIVAVGQVRVHLEEHTLAYLGEGEVFGEMALLESEPRLATVTAVVPTQLLRLNQQPFFELLEEQPDLSRGIITMLSGRLRQRWDVLAGMPEAPLEAA